MRGITKKLITGLLLVIMGLFILNTILFTHSHILPDGRMVTHAHPVKSTSDSLPAGQHTHTHTEYLLLDHSIAIFITAVAVALLLHIAFSIKRCIPRETLVADPLLLALFGRAPPVMVR